MVKEETIIELLEEHIRETDIFLVEVIVKPGNVIRVHVDNPQGISIGDCAEISRFLNSRLDRDEEDFSLEVSSPGVGNPFRVKQQYEKNRGRMIDVLLTGGDRMEGELQSVSDDGIELMVKGSQKEIRFEEIKTAKTIIAFN